MLGTLAGTLQIRDIQSYRIKHCINGSILKPADEASVHFLYFLYFCIVCTYYTGLQTLTVMWKTTCLQGHCAVVLDHLEARYWRCMLLSPSQRNREREKHVVCTFVINLSVQSESSQFQNMLSLVGFYKRKWMKTTCTHTHMHSSLHRRKVIMNIEIVYLLTLKRI